jgi:hypothetical protein
MSTQIIRYLKTRDLQIWVIQIKLFFAFVSIIVFKKQLEVK